MKRLEQYLDEVCQSIGGPWEMREHVRQEMREHLLDAVAQHKAAGMTEEQALTQAIDEFGKPDDVRSELESTYGKRTTWIIDKALEWKEKTMRAKWLWMTWTYVTLALVIAVAVNWIAFANLFLVPKFHKLLHDGIIDPSILDEDGPAWMVNFLNRQYYFFGHHTTWLLLLVIAAVALFEWRVKSENKPWIRLSAFGTAAVGLMLIAVLMAGCMIISFCLGAPALGRMARPFALEQIAVIDTSMIGFEEALAKKDWRTMQDQVGQAAEAMQRLTHGPALTSLTTANDLPTLNQLRAHVKGAQDSLRDARQAIGAQDNPGVDAEMAKFRKAFAPVREAAGRKNEQEAKKAKG